MRRALVVGLCCAGLGGHALADPGTPPAPAPTDPEGRQLAQARALLDAHDDARAEALLTDLFTRSPDHPAAGTAAMLLLDSLNRRRATGELEGWILRLHDRTELLAAHPDLAEVVAELFVQIHRRQADRLEAVAARGGDLDDFERCGQAYLAAYNLAPDQPRAEELLFNGALCFERALSVGAALTLHRQVVDRFAASPLAPRALARVGRLHGDSADPARAAEAFEQLVRRYPASEDAPDALHNALAYRLAQGALAEAAADLAAGISLWGRTRPDWATAPTLALATGYLARGQPRDRPAARRLLARFAATSGVRRLDDRTRLSAARLLWDAACPDRAGDELCVTGRGARDGRDRALADAAQRIARSLTEAPDRPLAARARLLVADELLERLRRLPAIERRAGTVAHDAWFVRLDHVADDASEAYRAVIVGGPVETAIVAQARLGQLGDLILAREAEASAILARGRGRTTTATLRAGPDRAAQALQAYRACQALAQQHLVGADWLTLCDRGAVAHGEVGFAVRERVPALASTVVTPAIEPASVPPTPR